MLESSGYSTVLCQQGFSETPGLVTLRHRDTRVLKPTVPPTPLATDCNDPSRLERTHLYARDPLAALETASHPRGSVADGKSQTGFGSDATSGSDT